LKKKRNKLEIIYDLLLAVRKSNSAISITHLIRRSNLSPQSFKEYYYELISKEFIEEIFNENDKKYISITDRGRKYIHEYKVIIDFIEEFEL